MGKLRRLAEADRQQACCQRIERARMSGFDPAELARPLQSRVRSKAGRFVEK